jgi:hypothetical protein
MTCIYIYIMRNWTRYAMLLELVRVVDGGFAKQMVSVIVDVLVNKAGLTEKMICERFISMGSDGVSIFQGARYGVVRQL